MLCPVLLCVPKMVGSQSDVVRVLWKLKLGTGAGRVYKRLTLQLRVFISFLHTETLQITNERMDMLCPVLLWRAKMVGCQSDVVRVLSSWIRIQQGI
jgi:hypothetical protein